MVRKGSAEVKPSKRVKGPKAGEAWADDAVSPLSKLDL